MIYDDTGTRQSGYALGSADPQIRQAAAHPEMPRVAPVQARHTLGMTSTQVRRRLVLVIGVVACLVLATSAAAFARTHSPLVG